PDTQYVPQSEWDPIFAQLKQNLGVTWADFQKAISRNATLMPSNQGYNYSLTDDFQLEVQKAHAQVTPSISGKLFLGDTSHPLGNVPVRLFDSDTNQAVDTVSLTDGSYIVSNVPAGIYQVTFGGFVTAQPTTITIGSSSLQGVNYTLAP